MRALPARPPRAWWSLNMPVWQGEGERGAYDPRPMPLLSATNLCYSIGQEPILDRISLGVEPGEWAGNVVGDIAQCIC